MGKIIDLTGQRFGRLTVIEFAKKTKDRQFMWKCKCDCGNEVDVRGYSLRSGKTKSCGCLQKEINIKLRQTHGLAKTRLYNIWNGMKGRCSLQTLSCYKYYGDRGIKVCEEWQTFEPFYDWAMANGYRDDLTIDRIDVNGNYEPTNCRWITQREQALNTRRNHYITYNGETKILEEWAMLLGINHSTLIERLNRWNSIEEALTIPKGGKQKWG